MSVLLPGLHKAKWRRHSTMGTQEVTSVWKCCKTKGQVEPPAGVGLGLDQEASPIVPGRKKERAVRVWWGVDQVARSGGQAFAVASVFCISHGAPGLVVPEGQAGDGGGVQVEQVSPVGGPVPAGGCLC